MKKIYLLFLLISLSDTLLAQSCGSINFTTQTSIDTYAATHPGCAVIFGNVSISGDDITNLAGLNGLIAITGTLDIKANPMLTSLSGLSNVSQIGQSVNIESNPLITSLDGLGNLFNIGGSLRIVFNNGLQNISALSKIKTVNGFLSIGANPLLTSLSGLENLTNIIGEVSIAQNTVLTNVDALSALTSIQGYLFISENPALVNLTGLINLRSLGNQNYVSIINNNSLTSLSGLDKINPSEISALTIINSIALSYCGVESVCKFVLTNPTFYNITSNATGCNSIQEIKQTAYCISLPVTLINFQGKNTPEGNSLTWQTTSETTNYGFDIERSLNAKTFMKAGFVEGNGDTNETKSYSFTDVITEPLVYYRLKQIDFDQKFSYSRIIIIKVKDKDALTTVYPNPADNQLYVEIANRNQPYQLVNEQGIILQKASSIPSKPLETGKLPNGVYILKIGEESHKVLITR
ncbi:T9SS type A sorting domain-containing protein [Dyadobacter sp. CY345]|uniref:T9SS type A sorting domain-containing protein n=1 Tax=Dyadobacter sp. CY345 TaxID=2909335 RepID=UPI001F25D050|nr:T9SS type A sorting domain-containing protein [Dyadobacter sp. CY345]MCF2446307.1 T9SS type A sorting domain-containing protein [Dyadobacter sp. CY345]